jgi:hypothetical protein
MVCLRTLGYHSDLPMSRHESEQVLGLCEFLVSEQSDMKWRLP